MSKIRKPAAACDKKAASTLAASSIIEYFKKKQWKIISFFPNSPCAQEAAKDKQKL